MCIRDRFNAITRAGAQAANYPFCTIEPNTGVVPVSYTHLYGRLFDIPATFLASVKSHASLLQFRDVYKRQPVRRGMADSLPALRLSLIHI